MSSELYTRGGYLQSHPTWHAEHSEWKADRVLAMLRKHGLAPSTVCEVGCGAGEILKQLHDRMDPHVHFVGYDISPQAATLSAIRASERLSFKLGDFLATREHYDVLLLLDVFEHVEDYFAFLRAARERAHYKLFHIPLELSAQAVLRGKPLIAARDSVGHLHFFTKDLALRVLRDLGYEVVDHFYTPGGIDFVYRWRTRLARLPRKWLFTLSPDLAARTLGGYSLLVLTT
jgi:hypothetical protein